MDSSNFHVQKKIFSMSSVKVASALHTRGAVIKIQYGVMKTVFS